MVKVLHITPHLGGGVGAVLLKYLEKNTHHKVICLDYANENATANLKANNIQFIDNAYYKPQKILEEIKKADIVLIHWWNHPLLYDFLIRQELPECRMVLWSHIAGFHPPYVFTEKILFYPDLFVFTTPMSFESPDVMEFPDKNKLRAVWATGGVDHIKDIRPKPHEGFNIGYIGTVDYSKMHPDFLEICREIDIPDVKFIVCGGAQHKTIEQQAHGLNIEFTGQVANIAGYLAEFDVFGYPLAPYHYGTCDQVLQEAMAAGVVPVVLNNRMENYIIKHNETGLVANSLDEYVEYIHLLYENQELRKKLSENARKYAQERFSLENLNKEWNKIFAELMYIPKTIKKWNINKKNISHYDVFLESLGKYDIPNSQSSTKGSVHHYYSFFKDDEELRKLSSNSSLSRNGYISSRLGETIVPSSSFLADNLGKNT